MPSTADLMAELTTSVQGSESVAAKLVELPQEGTGVNVIAATIDYGNVPGVFKHIDGLEQGDALDFMHTNHDYGIVADLALGGTLRKIIDNGWEVIYGYENVRDLVEGELGMRYRKAMYLVEIYDKMVELGISSQGDVSNLPSWTKLREMTAVLTKDNYTAWFEKVTELTVMQVRSLVREAMANEENKGEVPADATKSNSYSALSLQITEDQKETIDDAVEMAKTFGEAGSTADALSGICMEYMANVAGEEKETLADILKGYEPMQILETVSQLWPDIDISVSKRKEVDETD